MSVTNYTAVVNATCVCTGQLSAVVQSDAEW